MLQANNLALVEPMVAFKDQYLAMINEFITVGEGYPYNNIPLARRNFATFVQELEDEAEGIGLPEDMSAQQTYFAILDGSIVVGEVRFRPTLEPPFEEENGHIGYNIRPSYRGKGIATRVLALLLQEAQRLGLNGVLLTVEGENPASVRVIQKNGGKLQHKVMDREVGEIVSSYWIRIRR